MPERLLESDRNERSSGPGNAFDVVDVARITRMLKTAAKLRLHVAPCVKGDKSKVVHLTLPALRSTRGPFRDAPEHEGEARRVMPTTTSSLDTELVVALKRLELERIIDALPERLVLADRQYLTFDDLLLLVFTDEIARRDSAAADMRARDAGLDPAMASGSTSACSPSSPAFAFLELAKLARRAREPRSPVTAPGEAQRLR